MQAVETDSGDRLIAMRSNTDPQHSAGWDTVVDFWRASRSDWFSQDKVFDRRFRKRFLPDYMRAAAHELDAWAGTAEGALALLILLDQFPRNAFRGTARMYATDGQARNVARMAVRTGCDAEVDATLRLFFYLPFAHAENLDDQRLSVALHRRLGQPWLDHALGHAAIIERFGRFPHRNVLLGRETTPDEQAFLDNDGFAG